MEYERMEFNIGKTSLNMFDRNGTKASEAQHYLPNYD